MFLNSLLFLSALCVISANAELSPSLDRLFEDWSIQYRVKFENGFHRENVFRKWVGNHLFIEKHNQLNATFTLGHNQFSGMDSVDFSKWLNRIEVPAVSSYVTSSVEVGGSPASVDWVSAGAVTPVKDQGQCGSCWSFSTTGALEGAYFIKYGRLLSFSEQQLVDCDTLGNGGRDHGCNGGLMDNAFTWIGKNNGLCLESEYPYVSGTTKTAGSCSTQCSVVSGSDVVRYVDVTPNSDSAFISALAQQPVSIAIEADQREFQLYKSGVFTATCGINLDHGVLAVGYGTDSGSGLDFYKVKNSWSSSWGEGGFIRLARGSKYNAGSGQCGILMQASYPVL